MVMMAKYDTLKKKTPKAAQLSNIQNSVFRELVGINALSGWYWLWIRCEKPKFNRTISPFTKKKKRLAMWTSCARFGCNSSNLNCATTVKELSRRAEHVSIIQSFVYRRILRRKNALIFLHSLQFGNQRPQLPLERVYKSCGNVYRLWLVRMRSREL